MTDKRTDSMSLVSPIRKAWLTSKQIIDLEDSGIPIRALAKGAAIVLPASLLAGLARLAGLTHAEAGILGLAEAVDRAKELRDGKPCIKESKNDE